MLIAIVSSIPSANSLRFTDSQSSMIDCNKIVLDNRAIDTDSFTAAIIDDCPSLRSIDDLCISPFTDKS